MKEEKLTQALTDLCERYPGVVVGNPTLISLREWQRFTDEEFIFMYLMPKARFIAHAESRTMKYIDQRRRKLGLNKAQEI